MSKELSLEEIARQCMDDSNKWFGDTSVTNSIPYMTLAMFGEAGEFANIVKKIERGSLEFGDAKVRYDLTMELVDVFIYLMNISALLRVDMYKGYMHKRAYNEKRFSAERAQRDQHG